MLEWLKYTFGSFFFNKVSKEGANRSLWNVIFALFMLLMILTAFCSTGFNYSFSSHYVKASEYKEYTGIRKESLRDNMTDLEVALTDLGEIATRELAKKYKPDGFYENRKSQ